MRSTHKVGIKKVDIELVCFFQSEKNAGALSCVLICILLILSASVTPKKRATYTLPSLFFFNPSLSLAYADESRVSVVIQGCVVVCVCLVRLPVQATLTVIYLQQEHTHTEMMEGVSTGGDRLSVTVSSSSIS